MMERLPLVGRIYKARIAHESLSPTFSQRKDEARRIIERWEIEAPLRIEGTRVIVDAKDLNKLVAIAGEYKVKEVLHIVQTRLKDDPEMIWFTTPSGIFINSPYIKVEPGEGTIRQIREDPLGHSGSVYSSNPDTGEVIFKVPLKLPKSPRLFQ